MKSPRGDFTKTQLPDSIGLSVTRVLTPIGYIALQFDSGGGAQQCFLSSSLVFVSRLVSLPRDEVLSRRDEVLSRWRLRFITVVGRNNERARASLPRPSLLPPSRRVCVLSSLSSLKRETGRALPRFVWLSVIQLRGPD